MRASSKLIVSALSFSLIGCKPQLTAENAIAIGRKSCAVAEKTLTQYHGKSFQMRREDWKVFDDGVAWVASAKVYPYHFVVVITRAGTPSECKWGLDDA